MSGPGDNDGLLEDAMRVEERIGLCSELFMWTRTKEEA